LKGHERKGNQFWYTLHGQTDLIEATTPDLVQRLVAAGCKIYMIQPVMRDLETIFGEITANNKKVKPAEISDATSSIEKETDTVSALVNGADAAQESSTEEGHSDAN
jgi:hypothetical protein